MADVYFVATLRRLFPSISTAHSYSAWYFCEILTLLLAGPVAGKVFDITGGYGRCVEFLAVSAVLALVFQALRALYWDGRTERTVVLPEPTR
jgi:hypothetical protein